MNLQQLMMGGMGGLGLGGGDGNFLSHHQFPIFNIKFPLVEVPVTDTAE